MDKVRIYELAKELNTTSKRLMEKLAEININVKNHMSLLESDQLEALYNHIGVIRHDETGKAETEEKKAAASPVKTDAKKEVKKDVKSAPRIIRTTEVFVDSRNDTRVIKKDSGRFDRAQNTRTGDSRDAARGFPKQDIIRVASSNSGLRPGFVRDNKPDYKKDTQTGMKTMNRKEPVKEAVKIEPKVDTGPETRKDARFEQVKERKYEERKTETASGTRENARNDRKYEAKPVQVPETKSEQRYEPIPEYKHEDKSEQKYDLKTEKDGNEKPEQRHEAKQADRGEEKPEQRHEVKPEQKSEKKSENEAKSDAAHEKTFETKPEDNAGQKQKSEQIQDHEPKQEHVPAARKEHAAGERQDKASTPRHDVKQENRQDARAEVKKEVKKEQRPEHRHEQRPEQIAEQRTEQKAEQRAEQRHEQRSEQRPEQRHEQRPEQKNDQRSANRPVQKTDVHHEKRFDGRTFDRSRTEKPAGDTKQTFDPRRAVNRNEQGTAHRDDADRTGRQQRAGAPGGHYENRMPSGTKPPVQSRTAPKGPIQGKSDSRFDNRREQTGGYGQDSRHAPRQGARVGDPRHQGPYRPGKQLEIPKPEITTAQKEEMISQRSEARREFQVKDVDRDVKRDQKKEVPKVQTAEKAKKFKPQKIGLGEKKGVSEVLSEDYILQEFYTDDDIKKNKKAVKPRREIKNARETKYIPPRAVLTSVKLKENIMVKDLAEILKKTSTDVIKKLMGLGMMATLNQEIDFDTASIIADEFGIKAEKEVVINEEDILFDDTDDAADLEPRPPVVVVMGHVDHGKTSLLDAIRETNVIDSEAGGITQHIGAYMVTINNRNITFLDTPGHEAFTAMRARGAQVTDIAILVVAADDGVMPQTIEAINHAKAANVSIIVAINKIDKPGANPDKVKQELTQHGLVVEEWGGDVICVPVSAKKRINIDHLLEMVLLAADILELRASPHKQAKGTVIEARLDKDRGPIATVLVQRGTVFVGDSIVTGTTVGRIRAMVDDKGHRVKKAGPSTPVEILGLPEVPEAGETFYAITDEKVAKQLAEKRRLKQREMNLKSTARISLEDLFNQIKEGKVKELNLIVKADVQGSVEAVEQSLEKLSSSEVRVKIIHGGVGAITESDVTLASVSNAIIIGFNVRSGHNVTEAAENAGVDIRLYRIIYEAIDDIQAALKGMLEPTYREVVQGHTEIRQIFKVSGVGTVGGCYVTDGKITRNSDIRLVRNGIVVHEGKLASLKRFKDDAKEVLEGFECGLSIDRYNDIKEGDVVESYAMEEVTR